MQMPQVEFVYKQQQIIVIGLEQLEYFIGWMIYVKNKNLSLSIYLYTQLIPLKWVV